VSKREERPSLSELSPRKREEEKKRAPSNHEIEKNLKESLTSTDEGLKQFLASLRQAGMPEAVQGYRAMQMVIVQQRLWVEAHHRSQLQPLFRSIAQTSGEIHRIFASFADVMKMLKEVDKLRAPTAREPPKDG
jgi:hypothetical protein